MHSEMVNITDEHGHAIDCACHDVTPWDEDWCDCGLTIRTLKAILTEARGLVTSLQDVMEALRKATEKPTISTE